MVPVHHRAVFAAGGAADFVRHLPIRPAGESFILFCNELVLSPWPFSCLNFQLVREIGITKGDEGKVGYYVGLLVRLPLPTHHIAVTAPYC